MSVLFKTHPDIYRELKAGQFTVQKMKRDFSAMPIYEAQEKGSRTWAEQHCTCKTLSSRKPWRRSGDMFVLIFQLFVVNSVKVALGSKCNRDLP